MAIRAGLKDPAGKQTTESDIAVGAIVADHADQYSGPTKVASFEYDFARLGGAVSAITLTDSDVRNGNAALTLPYKAIILRAYIEAITTATSGGAATIALGFTGSASAFVAATAYSNAMFIANGVTALTASIPTKVTTAAGVSVLATIAAATVTAGKFRVHVEYRDGA